jgi:UPF0042 nucleotide-binding protein
VASYVLDRPDTWVFMDKLFELLEFLVPRYQKEGKTYVTVAIGCTGGKHRSVAIAHALAARLKQAAWGQHTNLVDRDADKE